MDIISSHPPGTLVQLTGIVVGPANNGNSTLVYFPGGKASAQWAIHDGIPATAIAPPMHPDDFAALKDVSDDRKQ